jgi:DNA helicase IV
VHPDFYYPARKTIHEHLAINADGSSPFADYIAHAESKLAAYRKAEMDVFQTTSAQASNGSLVAALEAELAKRSVPFERKSYSAIVQALEPVVIKHYHKLVAVCIKHIRASHLTLDMLLERAKSLHDHARAKEFARAVWTITEAYSRKLEEANRIDFDSMIANATRLVESGQYQSPYSLILADEFQDISEPSANLIKALKHQKPFTKIFAVGDDWQSIYRFAGSDITIFTQFEANFGASWQGRLEQTYRCNQLIAETAASFVQRNPTQLKKSVRSTRPAIPRSIRVIPIEDDRGKPDFADACKRLLTRLDIFLGGIAEQWRDDRRRQLKVMVLWRYNQLDPFKRSRPRFENIDVSGLSFHRAKGLEADYTILLDVSEGEYGVPSRIEDDELLNLVMPRPETFEHAEERRLFYVALTRASRGVFLLTNSREPSRYIRELSEIAGDNLRFETVDGDLLRQCPACRVGQLVERRGRNNSRFFGCNQYPDCDHTSPLK